MNRMFDPANIKSVTRHDPEPLKLTLHSCRHFHNIHFNIILSPHFHYSKLLPPNNFHIKIVNTFLLFHSPVIQQIGSSKNASDFTPEVLSSNLGWARVPWVRFFAHFFTLRADAGKYLQVGHELFLRVIFNSLSINHPINRRSQSRVTDVITPNAENKVQPITGRLRCLPFLGTAPNR
jgi:hypothetical protein